VCIELAIHRLAPGFVPFHKPWCNRILRNLRNLGMVAEDGPWFSGRSVPLGSMFHPPRHRRWPHRGRSLLLANPPQTALIYSPELGVFDVASVCFSLRRGRVISSGVFDVVDVADAVPEVNGSGWALARRRAVCSGPVTGRERGTAQTGRASRWASRDASCVEPCVDYGLDDDCGRLRARPGERW
jgi:hypothetical protein